MDADVAGAVLIFYGVLLAVGVAVIIAVALAAIRGGRLPWYAWLFTGAVLLVLGVAFWSSLMPVETVDGRGCVGVTRDYLFDEGPPGAPYADECVEEWRIRVVGWLSLAGLLLVPWLVVMLSGTWRTQNVPGQGKVATAPGTRGHRTGLLGPVLMSDLPVPPIVTDDNGDIEFHSSVEAAERDMEAIDVLDGVYDVFDSMGRRLSVGASEGLVQIWLDPDAMPEPEELEGRLREYIARVGPGRVGIADMETASLDNLIRALSRFFDIAGTDGR
jgi:hypothetical protein